MRNRKAIQLLQRRLNQFSCRKTRDFITNKIIKLKYGKDI